MNNRYWPTQVDPLPWWGGKRSGGKDRWIASLLPWDWESTYVEPFGGMAAVMVLRSPVRCEIFNDLDSRITNWWKVLREETDELDKRITLTPHSREEYCLALDKMDDPDPIVRAWAFHIVVEQGIVSSPNGSPGRWAIKKQAYAYRTRRWVPGRLHKLAERIWDVQVENRDAYEVLEYMAVVEGAVIYCDPPYVSSDTSPYKHRAIDKERMTELLQSQKGRVAISGYVDEWEHLGWDRHEKDAVAVPVGVNAVKGGLKRVEVLWTNYNIYQADIVGGLFG